MKNEQINIIIKTWDNETNGIYNFKEDNKIKIKTVTFPSLNNNSYIIRKKKSNNIINENQHSELREQEEEILFFVRKSFKTKEFEIVNIPRKNMTIEENNIDNLNNRLWYVVKSENEVSDVLNDEEYILNKDDIIKLGRRKFVVLKKHINSINDKEGIKYNDPNDYNISEMNKKYGSIFNIDIKSSQYKIKENEEKIKCDKENKEENNNNDSTFLKFDANNKTINQNEKCEKIDNNYETPNEDDENEMCRICYSSESTRDNPKLRLCSCKDYIHYECLKLYISTKLTINENEKGTVRTYNCPKFNCDVCLKPYPFRFRIPEFDKIYELIDINMPSELDYIALESLDFMKESNNLKVIHLIQLTGDDLTIGRYTSNDIVDMDISVSRRHAVLKYNKENGDLILKNLSEKFGTLVLIKGKIKMKEKEIDFQAGKSFIKAKLIDSEKGSEEYTIDGE